MLVFGIWSKSYHKLLTRVLTWPIVQFLACCMVFLIIEVVSGNTFCRILAVGILVAVAVLVLLVVFILGIFHLIGLLPFG